SGDRIESLTRRGRLPQPDKLPDEEAGRLQAQSLRRLDQVLEALKDENGGGRLSAAPSGSGGGGGGGGEGADDNLPPTAKLKVRGKLKEEANKRTEEFAKAPPDRKDLDDRAKAELEGIRRDQQDVAELLEQLRGGGEPNAAEGDKP